MDNFECTVKYIPGHNPDLVLSQGGVETDRVDLTAFRTQESLRDLFESKGLRKAPLEDPREL